jgi:hypothetical protein
MVSDRANGLSANRNSNPCLFSRLVRRCTKSWRNSLKVSSPSSEQPTRSVLITTPWIRFSQPPSPESRLLDLEVWQFLTQNRFENLGFLSIGSIFAFPSTGQPEYLQVREFGKRLKSKQSKVF